jgi:hypothetical protein
MRWIASMVAEAHRILMRGGVFMYPRDTKDPAKPGRLRLLYEANPIGFIMEQAGGRASTGRQPMLGVKPTVAAPAHRPGVRLKNEVERIERYHAEPAEPTAHNPLFAERSLFRDCRPAASSATEAQAFFNEPHHVRTPPHHRHHRFVRRRHHLGHAHLREHLPPRNVNAAVIEGDSFHRYDRKEMKIAAGRGREGRQQALQPLRAREQPVPRTGAAVPRLRRPPAPASAASTCTTRRGRALQAGPRAPSRPGKTCPPAPTCCSTKACTARWSRPRSTSRSTPTC